VTRPTPKISVSARRLHRGGQLLLGLFHLLVNAAQVFEEVAGQLPARLPQFFN